MERKGEPEDPPVAVVAGRAGHPTRTARGEVSGGGRGTDRGRTACGGGSGAATGTVVGDGDQRSR